MCHRSEYRREYIHKYAKKKYALFMLQHDVMIWLIWYIDLYRSIDRYTSSTRDALWSPRPRQCWSSPGADCRRGSMGRGLHRRTTKSSVESMGKIWKNMGNSHIFDVIKFVINQIWVLKYSKIIQNEWNPKKIFQDWSDEFDWII